MTTKLRKRGAAKRATSFSETRKHHHSEAAEDYTELIADLLKNQFLE